MPPNPPADIGSNIRHLSAMSSTSYKKISRGLQAFLPQLHEDTPGYIPPNRATTSRRQAFTNQSDNNTQKGFTLKVF
ncbi:hypothetical protein [Methylocaldum sp. RMAD-M]|jgi:hypothetical protein|uniref:hypothetical protein n=1 Tax=unclassified Methylocaldum TaxID=2622260 RepID=UPI000A32A0C1|nr:hypothetical protein [Methylocaldum sp. RMAD-M]MBP1149322.1 hypothetical protein [Methylocaldum sp. RMAD-M]